MISIFRRVGELEARQLVVYNCMLRGVPSSKAKIDAPNKSHHVINNAYLLVVSPEKGILSELVRRSLHKNVWMQVEE